MIDEWNAAYDEAIKELERRLKDKCRLIPPDKIPQVMRAVHKTGTVGFVHDGDTADDDTVTEEIVLKHTVYELYGEPFLEFKAVMRGTVFEFIIRNLPDQEDSTDGTEEVREGG